jgi:threonine/homoserine/homoserine lactone efflux protein
VATVLVAGGVGLLVAEIPFALSSLTLIGAAYLVWLGIKMVSCPPVPTAAGSDLAVTPARWLVKGFGVSGLNPKVFLLFVSLLPQFTSPTSLWPIPLQIIMLGIVHVINCGIVYALVAASSQSVLRARPEAARTACRVSGVVMLLLAIFLIVEPFLGH